MSKNKKNAAAELKKEIDDIKWNISENLRTYHVNDGILSRQEALINHIDKIAKIKKMDLTELDPKWGFQKLPQWEEVHAEEITLTAEHQIEKLKDDGSALKAQQERIVKNYLEAVEKLREKGADVSEYENQKFASYIG